MVMMTMMSSSRRLVLRGGRVYLRQIPSSRGKDALATSSKSCLPAVGSKLSVSVMGFWRANALCSCCCCVGSS